MKIVEFVGTLHQPAVLWSEGGGIAAWSRGAGELFGYLSPEASGRPVDDLLQAGERTSGGDAAPEITYTAKDGRRVVVERRRQAIELDGEPFVLETVHDVTRRWLDQTELKEREREFRSVFDVANVGKTVIDPLTRRFIRANAAFCEMTGYTEAELLGKTVNEINHPDDYEADREQFLQLLNGETSVFDIDKRYVRKNGQPVWVHVTGNMIRDAEGRPLRATAVVTDISTRRELEERVRAQFDELENIYRTAPIGLAMISDDLRFVRINEWLAEINGFPAAEHVGKRVGEVVPDLANQAEAVLRTVLETGEPVLDVELEGETPSQPGVRRTWKESWYPVKNSAGRAVAVSIVVEEITERRMAEEALRASNERERAARQEAEAANRAKDDFLAVLSHELRTPLHAMKGWVSLLESGAADRDDWARAAEVIKRNLDAQSSLVDDLLDVSRIISGTLVLEKEKVSPARVIFDAIEDVRRDAEERGLSLKTDLDQSVGTISADPQRLRQAVNNLLTNAIKFTGAGGGIVVRLDRTGETAQLTVADTGIGIAPDVLTKIFDRFHQADSTTRRRHGGLGLGLAIVKHLVELHGGTVAAASGGPGLGSEFRIRLPLGDAPPLRTPLAVGGAGERTEPSESILAGMKILVVDDNEDARALLRIALKRKGAEVVTAESGAAAIAALGGGRFDLLVCDIGMPDMDGHDLLGVVRGQLDLDAGKLPAIALSGFAGCEDRERSFASGFQLHVAKPVDPLAFSKMARAVIDRVTG